MSLQPAKHLESPDQSHRGPCLHDEDPATACKLEVRPPSAAGREAWPDCCTFLDKVLPRRVLLDLHNLLTILERCRRCLHQVVGLLLRLQGLGDFVVDPSDVVLVAVLFFVGRRLHRSLVRSPLGRLQPVLLL